MTAIRFIVIQPQALLAALADGRLRVKDLDACLYCFLGDEETCRATLARWAGEFVKAPAQAARLATQAQQALTRAREQERLSWRPAKVPLIVAVDALCVRHGFKSLVEIYQQSRKDLRGPSGRTFHDRYKGFSPLSGISCKSLDLAMRSAYPDFRFIY